MKLLLITSLVVLYITGRTQPEIKIINPAKIKLNPPEVNFDTLYYQDRDNTTSRKVVWICNSGDEDLIIDDIKWPNEWCPIDWDYDRTPIVPGDSTKVTVYCNASRPGIYGNIRVLTNAGLLLIPIHGTCLPLDKKE